MIKVFSFVGTCSGEGSRTAQFSNMVGEGLRTHGSKVGENVVYESIRGDELRLEFCRGCESCFKKGVCPLDESDDMKVLKQKIKKADVFLFCSPVYLSTLTGVAKAVLDRMAYWAHTMEIAGKPTAVLVTTSNNHGKETVDLIADALLSMGVSLAYAGYASRHRGEPNINLPEQMAPEVDKICKALLDCLSDPSAYVTAGQDAVFAYWSKTMRRARIIDELIGQKSSEQVLVWERRGLQDYGSLSAYLNDRRRTHSVV